jgi:hypothetical protein
MSVTAQDQTLTTLASLFPISALVSKSLGLSTVSNPAKVQRDREFNGAEKAKPDNKQTLSISISTRLTGEAYVLKRFLNTTPGNGDGCSTSAKTLADEMQVRLPILISCALNSTPTAQLTAVTSIENLAAAGAPKPSDNAKKGDK